MKMDQPVYFPEYFNASYVLENVEKCSQLRQNIIDHVNENLGKSHFNLDVSKYDISVITLVGKELKGRGFNVSILLNRENPAYANRLVFVAITTMVNNGKVDKPFSEETNVCYNPCYKESEEESEDYDVECENDTFVEKLKKKLRKSVEIIFVNPVDIKKKEN